MKDQDMPGLAMSRSLGDKMAHSVGVSSLAEIQSDYIGMDDKFIVLGSDGVFEFLTNEQVAEIVMPFYEQNQPEQAANEIVKAAYDRWRDEEEIVDDITAVVVFLEPSMAYVHKSHMRQKSNSLPDLMRTEITPDERRRRFTEV